jgi:pSer/pThr/pTyr-binding forkhead associated (FHA) protein
VKLSVSRNNNILIEYSSPVLNHDDRYEVFIGRSPDCHIYLEDQLISRHHAVLRFDKGMWTINKLSSFGGMIVNGINLDTHQIHQGDVINVNDYILKIDDLPKLTAQTIKDNTNEVLPDESSDESSAELNVESDIETSQTFDVEEDLLETPDIDNENPDDSSEIEETETNFSDSDDGFNQDEPVGFNDDGFNDNESGFQEDEGGGSTKVLSNFASFSLKISGEYAPYDLYKLEDNEVFVGRDKSKCQIMLNDPEVSTVHAKFKKTLISLSVEDLNSSNGTLVNGNRINKAELVNGDEVIIGSTLFTVKIASDLIDQEAEMLMPVDLDQEIEVEEVIEEEVDFEDGDFGEEGGFDGDFSVEEVEEKSIFKNPKKRKKLIYIAVGLLLLLLLLDDDKPKPKNDETAGSKASEATTEKPLENEIQDTQGSRVQLTDEQKRFIEVKYQLGKKYLEESKFTEAVSEFQEVTQIDPNYENVQGLLNSAKEAFRQLEAKRKEAEEKIRAAKRQKEIEMLLERARKAVTDRQVSVAEGIFADIVKLDPENLEVPRLKLELDAWQKEEEQKKLEEARKIAIRQKKEEKLRPGRNAYIQQDWHKAIFLLTQFMDEKDMDQDLVKEGSKMLIESKRALEDKLSPLLGRARSLKEAQDLKAAYEAYIGILDIDPANEESLSEIELIKLTLNNRSRKIYREALIDESLSLFSQAKEKFQEVQQISPVDSEYYIKASEKLKNYLE